MSMARDNLNPIASPRAFDVVALAKGSCRTLSIVLWSMAAGLGAIHAWADRFTMGSDGLSYLEIGEAYLRGDWGAAINAYWSPLYSWLLGCALFILKPTPYWEFPVVHLVNFLIYLCALGCFHFLLRELIAYHQTRRVERQIISLSVWAWYALGYSLFIWSSLTMIPLSLVTPDMCVAAFVFLTSGILLRIRGGAVSWRTFGLLGLVLGFGYLAKAPMFPLAFVFMGVAILAVGNLQRGMRLGMVSLAFFLLIAGPFILALSLSKGRFTFGDTAKLNYVMDISGTSLRHWQGTWPPGIGTPKHPTRKIFDKPAVYEFGSPISATYPPWYDPSYWNEGMSFPLDLRKAVQVVFVNIGVCLDILVNSEAGIVVGLLILLLASERGWYCLSDLANEWTLLIPALAAISMYSLVHVYARFIGPFVVLLWVGVAAAVSLPRSDQSRTFLSRVSLAMATIMLISVGLSTAPKVLATMHEVRRGVDPGAHMQWQVAEGLRQLGVRPGDKVGIVGQGTFHFYAHWARLARVKIVAEIISKDVKEFLATYDAKESELMDAFASAGAKAVVADDLPPHFLQQGWQRVGNTDYFVFRVSG